jgi:hypothetical protein
MLRREVLEFGATYTVGDEQVIVSLGSDKNLHVRVDGFKMTDGSLFYCGLIATTFFRAVHETFSKPWNHLVGRDRILSVGAENRVRLRFETKITTDEYGSPR